MVRIEFCDALQAANKQYFAMNFVNLKDAFKYFKGRFHPQFVHGLFAGFYKIGPAATGLFIYIICKDGQKS